MPVATETKLAAINESLWHLSGVERCLGCTLCDDLDVCGGLQLKCGAYDCRSLCTCDDPTHCQYVCPRNVRHFVARTREVRGFDLRTIQACRRLQHPDLPRVVPLLDHGSSRVSPLRAQAVAVPLKRLFSKKTGELLLGSRTAIAKKYCFVPSAQIIVTGTSKDQPIEEYWSKARARDFAHAVLTVQPDLITTPNFSVFSDLPRWDNLYNMKRIAICWEELASAGTPTALHVNARTDRDYGRWTDLLRFHKEIEALSFEFQTGTASPRRATWHVERLTRMASETGRAMTLVALGGRRHLLALGDGFARVVFVTSDPLHRALHRQKLSVDKDGLSRWQRELTSEGQPVDDLFQHNLDQIIRLVEYEMQREHSGMLEHRNGDAANCPMSTAVMMAGSAFPGHLTSAGP